VIDYNYKSSTFAIHLKTPNIAISKSTCIKINIEFITPRE